MGNVDSECRTMVVHEFWGFAVGGSSPSTLTRVFPVSIRGLGFGAKHPLTWCNHSMKYLWITLFLTSCWSTNASNSVTILDGGASESDVVDSGGKEVSCPPLTCKDELFDYNCGRKTDSCGNSIECGACRSPWKCGVEDLQDYKSYPDQCGLGCKVVQPIPSKRCQVPFPVEHRCPFSKALVEYVISPDYRYSCVLMVDLGNAQQVTFCCGF